MGPHPLIGTKRSVVKLTTFGLLNTLIDLPSWYHKEGNSGNGSKKNSIPYASNPAR